MKQAEAINCNHNCFYILSGKALCLHKLFADGYVKAITREVTRDGVEFEIWRNKLVKNKKGRYAGKYKLFGSRSRLHDREQVLTALALVKKYNIQKVRL